MQDSKMQKQFYANGVEVNKTKNFSLTLSCMFIGFHL